MGSGANNGAFTRHRWVFEILERAGSVLEGPETGVFSVHLGPDLVDLMGRKHLLIAFQKKLAAKDGVELASPGSWFHDQLMRYAREWGRFTVGYLPPRADLDRDRILNLRRRSPVEMGALREKRYGVLYLFTFRISYYSDPAQEDLQHLVFDCERGRVLRRPLPQRVLTNGGGEGPVEGFAPPPGTDVRKAFRQVWEEVQAGVENRVRAIRQEGRKTLEENLETVERYYRQLIQEEKRLLKSRSSRRAQEEARQKIDLLKLEWERRVKEESERLEPQVVASLTAVAQILVPLERWRCTLEAKEGKKKSDIWLDLARAEAWTVERRKSRSR